MIDDLFVENSFIALLTVKNRDRDSPSPLAGYDPVRAAGDHVGDALLTPLGYPAYLLNCFQRMLSQVRMVERDKPLGSGTENDRVMAAPTMGVRVS